MSQFLKRLTQFLKIVLAFTPYSIHFTPEKTPQNSIFLGVIKNLSVDLQRKNPNAKGLSRTNIYYAKKFYLLYSKYVEFVPQTAGQLKGADKSHVSTSEIVPLVATLS